MKVFRIEVPLRWGDMDAMGHINNVAYYRLMEQARIPWFEQFGFATLPNEGAPILAHCSCDFVRALNYPGRKSWWILGITVVAGFFVLGFFGREVYRQAPPIPERVLTTDGQQVWTKDDILTGQQVWQSTGGQQLGSIWGHGAYMAPDWSADWLHTEALALLEVWAQIEGGVSFASLAPERQLVLRERLRQDLRANTYDPVTGAVTVSSDRREAIARIARHYDDLFGGAPALALLRENYAMPDVTVPDPERRQKLTAFFFWTSWAATTERPRPHRVSARSWYPHSPVTETRWPSLPTNRSLRQLVK